ncbi:hypothetical protein KKD72_01640 [Patescibacteria group bacterium]|nr:hypothetical protein [Patescibacteria group bacterium]
MNKKNIIIVFLVLIAALLAGYFYFTIFYSKSNQTDKIYTQNDFPDALKTMSQEILDKSLIDLNKQYQKLKEGDHVYIRWINVGILKKRLNDYIGAEQAWLDAIDYNSDQYLAYGNLADLYLFDLGQYQKAEEYYLKVLSMDKNNYNYYHGIASLYRYNLTDKKDQVEAWMLKGAENNPAEAESYYLYLANYFYEKGLNLTKAKLYSQKTLKLNPELKDQLPNF